MNFYRGTIEAGQEQNIPHGSSRLSICNFGPAAIFINFDSTANAGSLLIPPGVGRTMELGHIVTNVHVFAEEKTVIQIDGIK